MIKLGFPSPNSFWVLTSHFPLFFNFLIFIINLSAYFVLNVCIFF